MWFGASQQYLLHPLWIVVARRCCHSCNTTVSITRSTVSNQFRRVFYQRNIDGAVCKSLCRVSWRPLSHDSTLNTADTNRSVKSVDQRRTDIGEAQSMTFGEKVRENSRSTGYSLVIAAGVAITGYLLYIVGSELFGATSSQKLANVAQQRCLNEPRVLDALGRPVCMRGDDSASSGRRRQQRVAHTEYVSGAAEGSECRHRLRFQLKGSRHTGTVHADMVKNAATGEYDYRYLFVEVDNYSKQVVILEDNRADMLMQKQLPPLPSLS